jgi:putative transposase
MSRPLRIEFEGAVYHLTSRGNARQEIFLDDIDKQEFLQVLASVVTRFKWMCHAYCLMDNHYHLVVETPEGNLSRGMRQLNGVYTQRFNRRHKRSGHLFQGRYKSILVDKDSYLLAVCRYVVLNPVRAGIVSGPGQWKWTSYGATAGSKECPGFLTVDWVLSQFGRDKAEARTQYRRFVRAGKKDSSLWKELRGQILLGAGDFAEKFKALLKGKERIAEIPRIQRYLTRPSLDSILSSRKIEDKRGRDKSIHEAFSLYGYALREIADHLGVHYATVSRALGRVEKG